MPKLIILNGLNSSWKKCSDSNSLYKETDEQIFAFSVFFFIDFLVVVVFLKRFGN